ncbi:hypothetical protein [Gimesia sp.]|uniref:hypothetical protein n=1 Tax=Gimesia sp. TaxID=2024833 RepID=UPI000C4F734B|nr:hypothetical protein [Gimesia sp.]MAX37398.1 hypothetical protein [Gimesia sp.]HAH49540.1 hypothetical protein [Planctomycetaceae bacterium]HBL47775.1 hypothetical protein [Planctomycetaceae bacterium]
MKKNSPGLCGRLACFAMLLLFSSVLTGCGGPSAPPPSETQKSEVAKKSIDDFVAAAKKSPRTAAQDLTILMESLDAYASEYGGPYIELRDAAKELLALYQSSAAKDKIDAQLEVLQQKANALSSAD